MYAPLQHGTASKETTMLMEKLFSAGIMKMGPSKTDPHRQVVGVFNPDSVACLPALRAAEIERFR
jgi:hypothetical protein